MPPSLRRRAQQPHLAPPEESDDSNSDLDMEFSEDRGQRMRLRNEGAETVEEELVALEGDEELEDDDDDDALVSPHQSGTPLPNLDPPPPYLREISTLASWTVSSSKPGCSVAQLRHPSTAQFWQSDGPQPHYLNIHFFKLVRIVGLRLYLDFEQDESYTPTRIVFLAGSGMNDLQEWGEMKLESPRGWVWADFSGVGDADSDLDGDEDEDVTDLQPMHDILPPRAITAGEHASSDSENNAPRPRLAQAPSDETMQLDPQTYTPTLTHHQHVHAHTPNDLHHAPTPTLARPTPRLPFAALSPNTAPHHGPSASPRRPQMPVLRAHLVQIKILENHQNGKDTHLRGLQIFARNDDDDGGPVKPASSTYRREGTTAVQRSLTIGEGHVVGTSTASRFRGVRTRGVGADERLELGAGGRSLWWDGEVTIR